ncbi:MAG TPA: methyltransferase domain-containing protein [Acidimicrobiales bacterium]|nr:methyltransferase domain-containing protein [Acidimicrobiales bacterium]
MDLAGIQRSWDSFGRSDPLWSILTDPNMQGRRWRPDQFFATGVPQVEALLALASAHGVEPHPGVALDFGCGVGRLSQALLGTFARVVGVDIAPSMIKEARRYNSDSSRCRYVATSDLSSRFAPETFDFALSIYVLQHMAPEYGLGYVAQVVELLRPGGVAVVQAPTAPVEDPPGEEADVALPDGAYRAAISLETPLPRCAPGAHQWVTVRVRNTSDATWRFPRPPFVGNHWLTPGDDVLVQDDGRAALPQELAPGESAVATLGIGVPRRPGTYVLAVDVVLEGVCWFADRGSSPLLVTTRVPSPLSHRLRRTLARDDQSRDPGSERPVMEMHTVPEDDMVKAVAAAGGMVAHRSYGRLPGFEDCTYVITR